MGSSRFALDVPADAPKASGGLAAASYELFAGMIEFGLSIELIEIVAVTDARMERILRRAGWPLGRVGKLGEFVHDLAEMHRLRYRVFKQRLDWTVEVSGNTYVGLEHEAYSCLHADQPFDDAVTDE
ncbi:MULTISPECIES: acyl-homoserine-lactone synthase [unclassified Bradyrhizobium]|uniref:acyl-homoserine-lactone synthase n=1 Tax=unclassified Bradyrhizobium TaxID=2631580 RepID=UPI0031F88159